MRQPALPQPPDRVLRRDAVLGQVVIAIIAMLLSAMIPAVQSLRESARRTQCTNNLLQLVMAMQNYEMAHEVYPSGVTDTAAGPIRSVASGHHHGWVISLLPYLDEGNIHRSINPQLGAYDEAHRNVRRIRLSRLICPTEPEISRDEKSNYAACHHDLEAPIDANNHGVFFLNSHILADDVLDGLSYTIFLGEKRMDPDGLGWMSGTRATLRNTGTPINVNPWISGTPAPDVGSEREDADDGGVPERNREAGEEDFAVPDVETEATPAPSIVNEADDVKANNKKTSRKIPKRAKTNLSVGGFASHHPAGAHMAFGDGRIQFMDSQIEPTVFQRLGHRNDGKLLNSGDYRE